MGSSKVDFNFTRLLVHGVALKELAQSQKNYRPTSKDYEKVTGAKAYLLLVQIVEAAIQHDHRKMTDGIKEHNETYADGEAEERSETSEEALAKWQGEMTSRTGVSNASRPGS
jgi:hypothetical protein